MALPLVRIVSALAPVVMGAFDLYRKRREAKEEEGREPRELAQSPENLRKHLEELEEANVEQARLISELSTTVEALATTLQKEIDEGKRRDARMTQWVWAASSLSVASLGLVIWCLFR